MRATILLLCLLLMAASCEPRPDAPLIRSAPSTTVEVPVPTPCVDAANIPAAPPMPAIGKDGNVANRLAAISAYIRQEHPQAKAMREMLRVCSTQEGKP